MRKTLQTFSREYLAECEVNSFYAFIDEFELLLFVWFISNQHDWLQSIPDVMIHQIDYLEPLAEHAELVPFVQIKYRPGEETTEQVVNDSLRTIKTETN
jgi:hypothetical protein